MNDNGREFLFNILKERNGEWSSVLDSVYYKVEGYYRYRDEAENLPTEVKLTPSDIKEILSRIYELKGNYRDNTAIKGDIVSFIFGCVSDESKCNFLRSDSFEELYQDSGWYTSEFVEYYNMNKFLDSISDEGINGLFENISRKKEAQIRLHLGILDENLELKTAIVNFAGYPVAENQKDLELLFALQDIEVDFSDFTTQEGEKAFLKSDVLKNAINTYYEGLGEFERNDFIVGLSSRQQFWGRPVWLSYGAPDMKMHLQIFDAIEDESKYSFAGINILAGLLEYDMLDDDSKKLDVILRMHEQNPNDGYIYQYFWQVQSGKLDKMEVPLERLVDLIQKTSSRDDKRLTMGVLDAISSDRIKEYLSMMPENVSFCMNALTPEEADNFLSTIDDEIYKVRLLLSIDSDGKTVAKLFPHIEDEYVRAQLTIAKNDNELFVSQEDTEEKIANFFKIKEQFLSLSEEERIDFLCGLPAGEDDNVYKDNNEIKKSLLKNIENPEDRKRVIESMERYVSPDMQEYADLVETMIREYVEDNFELTPKQRERFEIVFRTTDVFFTTYGTGETNGKCRYQEKDITLAEHRRGDTKNIILDLLHEHSHAFSNADFLISSYNIGNLFEEGMADTFAEQVANYYFTKHGEVTLQGETYRPALPMVSQSSYGYQNGWVKSMIYPLEEMGQDKRAMQEFLFGDKKIFLDLSFGDNYSQNFSQDYLGNPENPRESEKALLETHFDAFLTNRSDSLYLIKNNRIPYLFTEAREKSKEKSELDKMSERVESDDIIFGEVAAANYALSLDLKEVQQEKQENER